MILNLLIGAVCVLVLHLGRTWYVGSLWAAERSLLAGVLGMVIGVLAAWAWSDHNHKDEAHNQHNDGEN